jgi:hypothetical protein
MARRVLWGCAVPDTVALVARDPDTRARLTGHLLQAGFHMRDAASDASQAVWVIDKEQDPQSIASEIRPWLHARAARHAVIITWRPTTVREAIGLDEARLSILIPPVFPWQLVDALRQRGSAW